MTTMMASPTTMSGTGYEAIGAKEFATIQKLMHDHAGIVLKETKQALVEARVNSRLRLLALSSYTEYVQYLEGAKGEDELVHLIDAITTNVTHFFREPDHIDYLQQEVAGWLEAGKRKFRFWSAGCSTGEEPYSLAMMLRQVQGIEGADVRILATDVSTRVLKKAMAGRYRLSKVEAVPEQYRRGAFSPDGGTHAVITDALKRNILFRRLNLNTTPYPIEGTFDAIFCRNVMIYFDRELRARIINEAHRLLNPNGLLVVGHAETLLGVDSKFGFLQPSVYRKVNA